ncbi:MAG: SGNH/GDSL hydrolase family protein [Lachnospiraceae bacterium]|nr:SGNH/GDSL hydrolase family protein [Lachnospiraceae bacterium]
MAKVHVNTAFLAGNIMVKLIIKFTIGEIMVMIYDQIEFHNVEEITATDKGCLLSRLPLSIARQLNEGIPNSRTYMGAGVELRFRMPKREVTLHLRADANEEAQTALIYFGSIQGGWQYSSKTIGEQDTALHIPYPENMDEMERISQKAGLSFSPWLVRVLLPYGTCYYLGKEGETLPPLSGDEPTACYLAYGSSITHGSLGLVTPLTYVFRITSILGTDCLNQGYAGCAHMERTMAEYLVSRKDWTFASLEMGVNMLGTELTDEAYEKRICDFLQPFKEDDRPVFVTDIFTKNGGNRKRAEVFREIVRRNTEGSRLIYTPGKELLSQPEYISADMTHPTLEGQMQVAQRWSEVMRRAYDG